MLNAINIGGIIMIVQEIKNYTDSLDPASQLKWYYIIDYGVNYLGEKEEIESDEWYESEDEAELAAEEYISSKLENGER